MPITVTPTQANIFTTLGDFLTAVLPAGISITQAQANRVAEPSGSDFVLMTPLRMPRLGTNISDYVDAAFTGSISGTTLTVTEVNPDFSGQIGVNSPIFGVGVTTGTYVTALGTGTGGVGTYTVNVSQTVESETLAAGTQSITQPTEIVMQIDVHGPNGGDNSQIITTAFRDAYGVALFNASGFGVSPLYTSEPRQIPFLNDQQQYEFRYVIEAHMQSDRALIVPQQFADALSVNLVNVDAVYPPT